MAPEITVSGVCPGEVTVNISGVTPDGLVAILAAASEGTFTVPGGRCAGTELGLADPRVLTTVTADINGEVSLAPTVSAGACGLFIQAADVTTCMPSNVAQVP